jgi:microcin C transport system substrate-binding protein
LRKAQALLKEAGWTIDPATRTLKNADGKPFEFEILLDSAAFERIAGPFVKNLRSIGSDRARELVRLDAVSVGA